MDAFPFTNADWERVKDAALSIVNATGANDDVLADSLFFDLQETLHNLRVIYGNHPLLLETEADFCSDTDETIRLYTDALRIAKGNGIPSDSICLSYARALIESNRELETANGLLESCRERIFADIDSEQCREHQELSEMLASANGVRHAVPPPCGPQFPDNGVTDRPDSR